MKAVWNGAVIAESDETIVVEGNHYFPPDSVDQRLLEPATQRTLCFWKGIAGYFDIEAGDQRFEAGAWTYSKPFPWIRKIRDHVAFQSQLIVDDR